MFIKRAKESVTKNEAAEKHRPPEFTQNSRAYFLDNVSDDLAIHRKASCACGGGCPSCEQQSDNIKLQTKLAISTPGDAYEQEADQVAEQVMRMPEPYDASESPARLHHLNARVLRKYEPCNNEQQGSAGSKEEVLRPKALTARGSRVTSGVASQIDHSRGGGRPLSQSARTFFEPRFGYDFSQVRIHTDSTARESARTVNALAFTLGTDIVFGKGQYSTTTTKGKRLLAHELAHVIQQRSAHSSLNLIQRQVPNRTGDADRPSASGALELLPPVEVITTSQGVDFVSSYGHPGVGLRVIAPSVIDRRHFAYEMSYRPGDVLHMRPLIRIVKTPDIAVAVFGTLAPGLPRGRLPFDYEVYEVTELADVPPQGHPVVPVGRPVNVGSLPVSSPTEALTILGLGVVGAGAIAGGISLATAIVGTELVVSEATMAINLIRFASQVSPRAGNVVATALLNPMGVATAGEIGAGSLVALAETGSVQAALIALGFGLGQHQLQNPSRPVLGGFQAIGRVLERSRGWVRIQITRPPVRFPLLVSGQPGAPVSQPSQSAAQLPPPTPIERGATYPRTDRPTYGGGTAADRPVSSIRPAAGEAPHPEPPSAAPAQVHPPLVEELPMAAGGEGRVIQQGRGSTAERPVASQPGGGGPRTPVPPATPAPAGTRPHLPPTPGQTRAINAPVGPVNFEAASSTTSLTDDQMEEFLRRRENHPWTQSIRWVRRLLVGLGDNPSEREVQTILQNWREATGTRVIFVDSLDTPANNPASWHNSGQDTLLGNIPGRRGALLARRSLLAGSVERAGGLLQELMHELSLYVVGGNAGAHRLISIPRLHAGRLMEYMIFLNLSAQEIMQLVRNGQIASTLLRAGYQQ